MVGGSVWFGGCGADDAPADYAGAVVVADGAGNAAFAARPADGCAWFGFNAREVCRLPAATDAVPAYDAPPALWWSTLDARRVRRSAPPPAVADGGVAAVGDDVGEWRSVVYAPDGVHSGPPIAATGPAGAVRLAANDVAGAAPPFLHCANGGGLRAALDPARVHALGRAGGFALAAVARFSSTFVAYFAYGPRTPIVLRRAATDNSLIVTDTTAADPNAVSTYRLGTGAFPSNAWLAFAVVADVDWVTAYRAGPASSVVEVGRTGRVGGHSGDASFDTFVAFGAALDCAELLFWDRPVAEPALRAVLAHLAAQHRTA